MNSAKIITLQNYNLALICFYFAFPGISLVPPSTFKKCIFHHWDTVLLYAMLADHAVKNIEDI